MITKVKLMIGLAGGHARPLMIALFIFSSAAAQNRLPDIRIPWGPIRLQRVIDAIENSGDGYHIHWKAALDPNKIVNGSGELMPLGKAMEKYVTQGIYGWSLNKSTICIEKLPSFQLIGIRQLNPAPALTVTVLDGAGIAIPYANLQIGATGRKFQTDKEGKVNIPAALPGDTILCTYTGKRSESIFVGKSRTAFITLIDQPTVRDTIFVTPYAEVTRKQYTGDMGEIRAEDINNQPASNLQELLENRIPGVIVTTPNGTYGSSIDIVLRGKLSILNGHAPLYIIDEVPYAPGPNSVSNITSGLAAGLNPLSFIDKDIIASIQVLKDADATAIYGSRGANGVIIITTKKHKPGEPLLSMGIRRGVSEITRLPRMMNIFEYVKMRREALTNDGLTPNPTNAPELLQWDTTRNVDWQKAFLRGLGQSTKAHIYLSLGGSNHNGFLGVNWLRETNVFVNHPAHDLFSVNGNFSHQSLDGRLRSATTLLAAWDKNAQYSSDVSRLQFLTPNAPDLLDKNGKPIFQYAGVSFSNPLSLLGDTYQAQSHNYLISTDTKYMIWDALGIKLTAGASEVQTHEYSVSPGWNQDPAYSPVRSSYFATDWFRSWILEPRLEYNVRSGDWNIHALAGRSWQKQLSAFHILSAYGFTNDSLLATPAKADSLATQYLSSGNFYTAWFGQLTWDWKTRLTLNLSGRRDGSSRFVGSQRYGNFGAVGLSWVFSEEPFVKKWLPFLAFGKFRASHGITGNDGIGGGQGYLQNWNPTSILNVQVNQATGSATQIIPDVSWEHVRKSELAMDLGFLQKRITLTATWYLDRSDHQLLPDSLETFDNIVHLHNRHVVVQNTGWEFLMTAVNIRSNNLSWITSINISLPSNKLVSFPGIDNTPFKTLVVGQSLSALRAYQLQRVDPQTGVFSFADRNGDSVLNSGDQTLIVKPGVRCFGGINNILSWRDWQIEALLGFQFQTGVNYQAAIYASNRPGSIESGLYSNETIDMMHRWSKPQDVEPYQKLTTKGLSAAGRAIDIYLGSSGIITNAAYWRLKNLSVSLNRPHLLGRTAGKIFLQAQNLFTMTAYKGADPENQTLLALPPLKTIVVGIDLML